MQVYIDDHAPLRLEQILIKLQGKVTSQWYLFGLAFGVPNDILEQLHDYSEEESLIELLDYWMRHHPGQPTWQEIADAQEKVEFYQIELQQAKGIGK